MKKIILVLALLLLVGGIAMADYYDPVRFDASYGIHYDAYPFKGDNSLENFAEALFNLRAGFQFGLGFNLSENLSIGAEGGLLGFYWRSGGYYYTLFDVPFHGFVDLRLADELGIKLFGGGIGIGVLGSSLAFGIVPEAGARLNLGGFYLEAAYVFGANNNNIFRYGLGFTANVLAEENY